MAIMDTDAEIAAFQAKGGGGRTLMKIIIGLLVVGALTFVTAYYLPLLRAHRGLVQMHREATEKVLASERSIAGAKKDLQAAKSENASLQADRERRETSERSASAQVKDLEAEIGSKLERQLQKGAAALAKGPAAVVVWLGKDAFPAGKDDASAKARGVACDVAKAAGARPLRIAVTTGEAGSRSGWSQAAARSASLAEALVEKCNVPAERVSSVARAPAGAAAPESVAIEIAVAGAP